MRVVQVIRAVALASVAAVLVGACGGGTTSSGSTGQRGTLKVGMQYDLGTLDPQVMTSVTDQQMVSNLFEGLVKYKLGGVHPGAGIGHQLDQHRRWVELGLQAPARSQVSEGPRRCDRGRRRLQLPAPEGSPDRLSEQCAS